ncbi:unnamed protein product, partial [Mesorhabditis spiculigera]
MASSRVISMRSLSTRIGHMIIIITRVFYWMLMTERPLSREEADFPLAYGLVVYKNIMQVLHMLSAFYQPQNLYCIAMDGHANETFKTLMRNVGGCFSNIHIIEIPRIGWGEYGIVTAVWSCLKYAAASQNQWKYYQYLSGVDVPLKTNLEMVRIFKALNGSMNMEFIEFQPGRLNGRKVAKYLRFLNGTSIPDEALWATLGGNPKVLPYRGSIPSSDFLGLKRAAAEAHQRLLREAENSSEKAHIRGEFYPTASFDTPNRYYVSRPELVAHKLYIDYEPATFFCLLKEHQKRTYLPRPFNASRYSELPQVEYLRGVPLDKLTHPYFIN